MSATVDIRPENPRACCILCAKWVCHECWDWRRIGAARYSHQICHNCGGIDGMFIAVRHYGKGQHWYQPIWIAKPVPTQLPRTQDEMMRARYL
jgi:hypothetical protein